MNEQIRSVEVRLVDEAGNMVGKTPTSEAIERAREVDMDLVVVSEGDVPVCKIIDYGKYQYQQKRRLKEARAKSKKNEIKEIRLRPVTDQHDLLTKAKKAKKFLQDGDKVKIVMRFRGREMSHRDVGQETLTVFLDQLGDVRQDKAPFMEGRILTTIVSPGR